MYALIHFAVSVFLSSWHRTVAGPRIRSVINLISLTLRSFMPVGLEAF